MLQSVLTPMHTDKPRGGGCFGGGCFIGIIVLLLLGGALFWGAFSTYQGIKGLTSGEARSVPAVTATDSEVEATLEKARQFVTNFDAGKEAVISLSATELNILIARYDSWAALRGKVFVTITGDKINAQTSLPLTQIRAMEDRFFNGDISMTFVITDGKPAPGIINVTANDSEMPRWAMRYITSKNFVESLGVPSISEGDSIGSNITVLKIENEKLIVHAKK